MREQPQRLAGSVLATVLCAALLLPGTAAAAGKRPSLAATAQYKAFVEYVKKLDGLVGQPTSAAQKDTYQSELTTKLEAATHKANALFTRGSDEAEAEANAKFKQQQATIRRAEGEETEALEAEFSARLRKAAESFREKVLRVETGHRNFEAKVNELIASLRGQKAELRAAERSQQQELEAAVEAKIEKSSKHWKQVFAEEKADLDSKRDSQLAYLTAKAQKGRDDIASMPASG
jgi:hypothetical protein